MSLNRYAKRRDGNEPEIIKALTECGCIVEQRDDIDLHVTRAGRLFRLEVKQPWRRNNLTKRQRRMRDNGDDFTVVTTPVEALRAVGLA